MNIDLKIYVNTMKHQFGHSECGMYSINFIEQMLKDNKYFTYLQKNRISDCEMSKMRKNYFKA